MGQEAPRLDQHGAKRRRRIRFCQWFCLRHKSRRFVCNLDASGKHLALSLVASLAPLRFWLGLVLRGCYWDLPRGLGHLGADRLPEKAWLPLAEATARSVHCLLSAIYPKLAYEVDPFSFSLHWK